MNRRWILFGSGFLLFAAPFVETAVRAVVPWPTLGATVFPFLAILTTLALSPAVGAWLGLSAAAWRDIVFILPFASTLIGAAVLVIAIVLARRFLTNRSRLTRVVMATAGYLGYAAGLVLAGSLAGVLGESRVTTGLSVAPWAASLGVLIFVVAASRRAT